MRIVELTYISKNNNSRSSSLILISRTSYLELRSSLASLLRLVRLGSSNSYFYSNRVSKYSRLDKTIGRLLSFLFILEVIRELLLLLLPLLLLLLLLVPLLLLPLLLLPLLFLLLFYLLLLGLL